MNQASKSGRRRRCPDNQYGPCMEFTHAGPLATLLDPRVGKTLPLTPERYVPTSPESYTIGTRLSGLRVWELSSRFGREAQSAPKRSRGGRRRRNRSSQAQA